MMTGLYSLKLHGLTGQQAFRKTREGFESTIDWASTTDYQSISFPSDIITYKGGHKCRFIKRKMENGA